MKSFRHFNQNLLTIRIHYFFIEYSQTNPGYGKGISKIGAILSISERHLKITDLKMKFTICLKGISILILILIIKKVEKLFCEKMKMFINKCK